MAAPAIACRSGQMLVNRHDINQTNALAHFAVKHGLVEEGGG